MNASHKQRKVAVFFFVFTVLLGLPAMAQSRAKMKKASRPSTVSDEIRAEMKTLVPEDGNFWRIMPLAGGSATSFSSADKGWKYRPGAVGGALLEMGSGWLVLQTGAMVIQTGADAKESGSNTTSIEPKSVSVSYLGIPLIGKVNFSGDTVSSFYLRAGVIAASKMSSEVKSSGQPGESEDLKQIRAADAIAIAGLGKSFELGSTTSLVIDAAYMRGMMSVSPARRMYNEGVSVTAGLAFGL